LGDAQLVYGDEIPVVEKMQNHAVARGSFGTGTTGTRHASVLPNVQKELTTFTNMLAQTCYLNYAKRGSNLDICYT
jgi:hypothetical protein